MKNKIKELHNKLSSSKISSYDSTISVSSFTSLMLDRFDSELKKNNIFWDFKPTTINELTKPNSNLKTTFPTNNVDSNLFLNNNISVGIDIQCIKDMPLSNDPWEDNFYVDNFNKNEISHCLKKKNTYESFAGIYALKEAIFKIDKSPKKDNKISFSKDGKPLSKKYSISISHDNKYAIAIAILNKNNEEKNELDLKQISSLKNLINNNKRKLEELNNKLSFNKKNKIYFIFYPLLIIIAIYIIVKDFVI